MTRPSRPLLEVEDLRTHFFTDEGVVKAVDGVSFHIDEGETLGLVGESGCGKSVSALSLMRLVPDPPGRIVAGSVKFEGRDILALSETEMRYVRGGRMAMVFQEPMTSLTPVLTIERQITEALELHKAMTRRAATTRAVELLEMVGIPAPEDRLHNYPHQLSGGQLQRVMIAIALSCDPRLLIADEATTALDVTIQEQILDLMKSLTSQLGTALLIITHNLGVVARYADRVNVMYAGKMVETGPAEELYGSPKHPYTVGLLDSVPRLDEPVGTRLVPIEGEIPDLTELPSGCAFRPRCRWAIDRCVNEEPPLQEIATLRRSACWESERVNRSGRGVITKINPAAEETGSATGDRPLLEVTDLAVHFPVTRGFIFERRVGSIKAVDGISFTIKPRDTFGLVGESGSGKTTTGRAIIQLTRPTSGRVSFEGTELTELGGTRLRSVRRKIGMVFQDSYGALNPRMPAGKIVGEPIRAHRLHSSGREYDRMVADLFEAVGLNRSMVSRYPHEFSGGQRQRIGVARALASRPSFIICDEPVSALDVSIQAQIINLLEDLQTEYGVAYLFIAHDLSVVRHISDRVAVMYLGKIVEIADSSELYANPRHPYTIALMSAVPIPDPVVEKTRRRIMLEGDIPSPLNAPVGCVFSTRCPLADDTCRNEMPPTREISPGHLIACFKAEETGK